MVTFFDIDEAEVWPSLTWKYERYGEKERNHSWSVVVLAHRGHHTLGLL